MRALRELTGIVEQLSQAVSFQDAVDRFVRWARTFTRCQAAVLRLIEEGESGSWLAAVRLDGTSPAFARDETLVDTAECICGRVASGSVDSSLPFFTAGGSFYWGRVGTIAQDFSPDKLGAVRGRCIRERYESVAVFP
ncbi:MAG: hypothetical protein H5T84_10025, partial [Thermoleophilia bacterium]|nr:hypothetical protein [Thermoleophilia bacterium]